MIQFAEGPGHTVDPVADEITTKAAAAAGRAVNEASNALAARLKKKRLI